MYNYDYSDEEAALQRRVASLITDVKNGLTIDDLSTDEVELLKGEFGKKWKSKLGVSDVILLEDIKENITCGLQCQDLTEEEREVLETEYGKDWKREVGYEKTPKKRKKEKIPAYTSYAECLLRGKKDPKNHL